jgi:Xaa-Pro dipeptidase
MLISVEPGLYVPKLGGFRHSDTVLITPDGYDCLTHYPTDLDALTLRSAGIFTKLRGTLVRKAVGVK